MAKKVAQKSVLRKSAFGAKIAKETRVYGKNPNHSKGRL
jgi:hypothetical protein